MGEIELFIDSLNTQFGEIWDNRDLIFWDNWKKVDENMGDLDLILQTLRSSFKKMKGLQNAIFLSITTTPFLGIILKTQQFFLVKEIQQIPTVFFVLGSLVGLISSTMKIVDENRDLMRVNAAVMKTLDNLSGLVDFSLFKKTDEYEKVLKSETVFEEIIKLNIVEQFYTWKLGTYV